MNECVSNIWLIFQVLRIWYRQFELSFDETLLLRPATSHMFTAHLCHSFFVSRYQQVQGLEQHDKTQDFSSPEGSETPDGRRR